MLRPAAQGADVPDLYSGVLILDTNRILGGDSGSVWSGRYELKGNVFEFTANVINYRSDYESMYGSDMKRYSVKGTGQVNADKTQIDFEASVVGHPDKKMRGRFFRISELDF